MGLNRLSFIFEKLRSVIGQMKITKGRYLMTFQHLAILLLLLLHTGIAKSETEGRTLLGPTARQRILDATNVYVGKIAAMAISPVLVPVGKIHPNSQKLSQEQAHKLTKMLLESQEISPETRLKECHYQPGLSFMFEKGGKNTIDILACFNCNLWAIENTAIESKDSDHVIVFGDLKPHRQMLLKIAQEIYQNEAGFPLPEK